MTGRFRRLLAGLLIVCMGSMAVPVPALAGIVSTDAIVTGVERERLVSLLERSEIQAQLKDLGVDAAAARARVAALSDAEAAQLASQLDELPAGGIDALGVALVVFLVLLFTDIMGYTKIFPFTRSAR
ncbi:MAG: PA2779 family protein [Betaproteobacteria bacterium]|nr:PA2779 family protein [Betaproteobacteria bacterium]